jgi:hypothetical protein
MDCLRTVKTKVAIRTIRASMYLTHDERKVGCVAGAGNGYSDRDRCQRAGRSSESHRHVRMAHDGESGVYRKVGKPFASHDAVKHNLFEYVRGIAHINSAESFFSRLKRQIYGTHQAVSPKHLHRYVAEVAFKHNTRRLEDGERTVTSSQSRVVARYDAQRGEWVPTHFSERASMLGIFYVDYKFPPAESQLTLVLFSVCMAAVVVGSLLSTWLLITRWATLTVGERWRLAFYALFL